MLHYNHSLEKYSSRVNSLCRGHESLNHRKFLYHKDRSLIDAIALARELQGKAYGEKCYQDYIKRNFMSEPEKGNLKYPIFRYFAGIVNYIISSAWRAVTIFGILGVILSYEYKLTMNSDVWFWFFSSIAQTFAALVALVAIFLISRMDSYEAIINKNMEIIRHLVNELSEDNSLDYFVFSESSYPRKLYFDRLDELMPKLELIVEKEDEILDKCKDAQNFINNSIYIINARDEIERYKQKKEQANKQMRILLEHTVSIIILSIFLIPFGAVNTEDSLMLALWNNFKLKWAIIFGVVGLCIASLYKVESILNEILSKEE